MIVILRWFDFPGYRCRTMPRREMRSVGRHLIFLSAIWSIYWPAYLPRKYPVKHGRWSGSANLNKSPSKFPGQAFKENFEENKMKKIEFEKSGKSRRELSPIRVRRLASQHWPDYSVRGHKRKPWRLTPWALHRSRHRPLPSFRTDLW